VIIPDANLLLYAYDKTSPFHTKASAWWSHTLSGSETVGLAPVVVFAFVRIGTSARAFSNPLTAAEAANHVRSWMAQPCVQLLQPDANHVSEVLKLIEVIGSAANLTTDAQLAALAMEYGAVLHTTDADFLRFRGLKWVNPLS
jgi:uncharacterized protein